LSGKREVFHTRREFIRSGSVLAAVCALPRALSPEPLRGAEIVRLANGICATPTGFDRSLPPIPTIPVTLDPGKLSRFVDPLPMLQVAQASGTRQNRANPTEKIPYYRLAMGEFESRVHRDLAPARQWGFNGVSPGPVIEAHSGKGIWVEWANELPQRHLFTIDHNLDGAEGDKPDVRAVVHLHGGKVPPESDGYPESWFAPGKSAMCYYPNRQNAAMLWYHDHAMGINRLNIYAGLLGAYIIRDDAEDALHLPSGEREISLVLCDRQFTSEGQLSYPVSPDPSAPWIPEFYGNSTLVNGKLFPYLEVQPTLYRFRILNGSNSQFFNLSLSNGQNFLQIGTDQGLLPAPVPARTISLAPAERVDVLVDFRGHGGEQIVLNKERILPVMQFRAARGASSGGGSLPAKLRPISPIPESEAVRTRLLTLNEYKTPKGDSMLMLLGAARWGMPVTENPTLDTVEIWSFINLTEDVHPIHLHLVKFQLLDRRPFDKFHYFLTSQLRYIGPAQPPELAEAGWKDTVRADPSMVTRIIVRFEGYVGRYVWHCHILEHEDNEMMRPFEVIAPGTSEGARSAEKILNKKSVPFMFERCNSQHSQFD
jgi:spore coat protein A, manganese oxidase